MIDVGSAIGYLMLDTSDFKKGFESALGDLEVFKDKSATAADKFSAVGSTLTGVGSALTTNVTLPLVGAGAAVTAVAGDYESSLKKMQSATGATSDEMKVLDETMKGVYESGFGESFEDVADSISTVRQQMKDLSNNELESVVEKAITLRDTFGYEVNESVRASEALMKNFGLSAEEAFDYIAYGAQSGLDWSDELIDTINEYSPQFKKLGLDADDMFNIFAKGAENGAWNLDKIGDAMKEFSIRAVDLSASSIQAFQDLGFAEDFSAEFEEGGERAENALNQVIVALREMDDPLKQNEIGVALFGTMWEDLGPQVVTNLDTINNSLGDVSGSMDNLMNQRYDSLSGSLDTLKNNAMLLAVEFGEVLLPVINDFVVWLTGLIQNFREMDDGQKQMIVTIASVVAAIGPALLIFGKISSGVSNIIGLFKSLGPILSAGKALFVALGGSISAVALPIAAAIAAIIAFKIAWDNNLGGIQERVAEMGASLREAFDKIVVICQEIWESIKSLWDSNFLWIQDIVAYYFDLIQRQFQAALDVIVEVFDFFANLFSGDWEGMWENVKNIVSILWNLMIENIKSFLDLIIGIIVDIGASLWDAAKGAFEWILKGFLEVWNSIIDWFKNVINDVVDTITGIGQALFDAGVSIFNMLWDGLKSVWDSITGWVSDGISWLIDKVTFWDNESKKIQPEDEEVDGSHRSGLSYVPYDGYRAELHKGERVLTEEENKAYSSGGSGNVYNFYSPEPIDAVQARREMEDLEKKLAEGL